MSDKFSNVPIDSDTAILFQAIYELERYDALYQKWFWEGIQGDSLIFVSEEVANLSDDEIIAKVKATPLLIKKDSPITVKRSDDSGFTFVNFNFNFNEL